MPIDQPTDDAPASDATPTAPTPPAAPPAERKHPQDWAAELDTPWPHLCLAAAVGGWDFTGNMIGKMSRAAYDDAIEAGLAKLRDAYRTAGVAEKHVLILPHDSLLHAVIVKRPLGAELRSFVTMMASDTMTEAQKGDQQAHYFASHCLWPVEGSPERQDLMECMPGAFFFDYPRGMQRIVGFTGGEVKKRA